METIFLLDQQYELYAPDKPIAGEKFPHRYSQPIQVTQDMVGTISHSIHDHRLFCFLQLFPAGGQFQQRRQHSTASFSAQ